MISDWNFPINNRNFSGTSAAPYTGEALPTLNYSRPQRVKINAWYQPTGCSRWGYGFFISDYARLKRIVSQFSNSAGASTRGNLLLNSQVGSQVSTRVFNAYMLPCHALSANAFADESLWLMPLVDERFFWQHRAGQTIVDAPDGNPSTHSTWTTLINNAGGMFGSLTSTGTVPTQYLNPNPFALSAFNHCAPTVLYDILMYSIGRRIIPVYNIQGNGSTTVFPGQQWLAADFGYTGVQNTVNLTNPIDVARLQSGTGTIPGVTALTPGSITVNFRRWQNGIVFSDAVNSRYSKTFSLAGDQNFVKVFNSTALADYTSGGMTPDNQTNLDTLANQIATDYLLSIFWIQDSVIMGISQWQETGYDDFVEFDAGYREPTTGEYVGKTRIHTTPYNFGCQTLFHYDTSTWEWGDKIYGTLDGNLSPAFGATQTITVKGSDGPTISGTIHLTVTNIHNVTGTTGQYVTCVRMGGIWAVIAKDCP